MIAPRMNHTPQRWHELTSWLDPGDPIGITGAEYRDLCRALGHPVYTAARMIHTAHSYWHEEPPCTS